MLERYLGWCTRKAIVRDRPIVVAIGGSVGKTSARQAVEIAMSGLFKPEEFRTSQKNYNNEIGLPISVFAKAMPGRYLLRWLDLLITATGYAIGFNKLTMRYLVLEMGADHPGDLDYLLNIAPPQVAIITAMGAEHIEYFGSVAEAVKEEQKILQALPIDGEAILNLDDESTRNSRTLAPSEIVGFGKNTEAVAKIESTKIVYDQENFVNSGLEVSIKIMGYHDFTFVLRGVFGEPHAYAAASALAFCLAMDHDVKPAVAKMMQDYKGAAGRTRLIKGIKKTVILDDTYNAQPQAMTSAIRDLVRFPVVAGGRRIAVLGDMLELGDLAQKEHEAIGKQIAESNIDLLICCGTLGRIIGDMAIIHGMNEAKVTVMENSEKAGYYLQQEVIGPGDVILAKGSQSMRMEKVVKELMAEPMRAQELLVRQTPEWLTKFR